VAQAIHAVAFVMDCTVIDRHRHRGPSEEDGGHISPSHPFVERRAIPLDLDNESQGIDSQVLEQLQLKHLAEADELWGGADTGKPVEAQNPSEGEKNYPASSLRKGLDSKETAVGGFEDGDDESQKSDLFAFDFTQKLEEKGVVDNGGGGNEEDGLNATSLITEKLPGKNAEPVSLVSAAGEVGHRHDDQIAPTGGISKSANDGTKACEEHIHIHTKQTNLALSGSGRKRKRPTKHKMDDWQPSVLGPNEREGSPTQENDSIAYAKVHHHHLSSSIPGSDDADELLSQPKTNVTDGGRSYDENETGGVRFSFSTNKIEDPIYGPLTHSSSPAQDEGYTMDPLRLGPETPAPPVNPFGESKAPLGASQLFANTQSSPVDPGVLQSGSSRPSPSIWGYGPHSVRNPLASSVPSRFHSAHASGHAHPINDFSSPSQFHNGRTPTSASQRTNFPDPDDTPLAKARPLSFNRTSSALGKPDPYEYVTREESQERRLQKQAEIWPDNHSQQDSYELEDEFRRMKRKKTKETVAKELARVSMRLTPKELEEVEVPATGKRRRSRSTEEEYEAQCFGTDARDTQSSLSQAKETQGDSQLNNQLDMTIADSQVLDVIVPQSLSSDKLSSKSDKDAVLAKDSFSVINGSKPLLSSVSEALDPQASSQLPALDENSGSDSGHRESSITPSAKVPRTSSGRYVKNSSLETPAAHTRPIVIPSTDDQFVPETSPVKPDFKPFEEDFPDPSPIDSFSHIGFTQDDPEYDNLTPTKGVPVERLPRGNGGVKVNKSNISVVREGPIVRNPKVAFSTGSSTENVEIVAKSSNQPILPGASLANAATQRLDSDLQAVYGTSREEGNLSSPIRPSVRTSRRRQHDKRIAFDTTSATKVTHQLNENSGSDDVGRPVSPIRPSVENIATPQVVREVVSLDTPDIGLLPCPVYSAGRTCEIKHHNDYYHDEELRQVSLRRRTTIVPNTSNAMPGSTSLAAAKTSISLLSSQLSERSGRIGSPDSTIIKTRPVEQDSEYATALEAGHRGSSSSLSELPSEYENDEFFTAGANDDDHDLQSEDVFRDSSRDKSIEQSPSVLDTEFMPPPTVRRTLRYSLKNRPTAMNTPKSVKDIKKAGAAQKSSTKTDKGSKGRTASVKTSSASQRSLSSELLDKCDQIIVDQTPIRNPRPARSTRRASINYDCKSAPTPQPRYNLRPVSASSEASTSEMEEISSVHSKCTVKHITKLQRTANRNLFKNMAFAISYKGDKTADKADKASVTDMITYHGGRLLDGFNELFLDSSTSLLTTPAISRVSAAPKTASDVNHVGELALAPNAQDLGFVAFIGDHYTRKSKFVQALALGLPCLSGRWISTCVARNRIVPFPPYLLAAGESAYLGGAVRSRSLVPYDAATAKLRDTFEMRERLLGGKRVVFCMGRGKAEERKRAYLFLTRALGAGEVRRVINVKEAKEVVEGNGKRWDLVYVDDDKKIKAAEAEILGTGEGVMGAKKGKRKRTGGGLVEDANGEVQARKKVKVVSDEFVVQSLILGCLMDED